MAPNTSRPSTSWKKHRRTRGSSPWQQVLKQLKSRIIERALSGGAVLLVCACDGSKPGVDRPIEVLVPTETAILDPRHATRALDIKITRLAHAGLVGLDPRTLEPVPYVAASLHKTDAFGLDVQLRPLRFHSGRRLEAKDVCATLSALADPALKSPHRAVVRAIGSCMPTAHDRLQIRLREPRASLLTDLEVPVLRADQARLPLAADGQLDGLGPFRVTGRSSTEVRLSPAETGLFAKPHHSLVVRSVRDENARALRLLAGRSDIAPNAISPALLPALEASGALRVRSRQGANVTYLLMQNDRSPFDRLEVRHAISQAIDRRRIVQYLLAGRASVASAIFPRGHWAHERLPEPEAFDPRAARAVLRGLPNVTLMTSTDRARVTIARAMAQMLADAGLTVQVVPLDLGVLLTRLDAGDYLLASLQMPELTEPNLLKWFFHPSAVPGEGGEGKNRARYRNPEAGRLLDRAATSFDSSERRRLYTELAELMSRDMPVVPLWHEDQVAVVSARASDFELSAEGRWLSLATLR